MKTKMYVQYAYRKIHSKNLFKIIFSNWDCTVIAFLHNSPKMDYLLKEMLSGVHPVPGRLML